MQSKENSWEELNLNTVCVLHKGAAEIVCMVVFYVSAALNGKKKKIVLIAKRTVMIKQNLT